MGKKWIPQEGLKILACVTMLLDHIGLTVILPMYQSMSGSPFLYYLYWLLRIVGRMAFPLYCFLLVEGLTHTSNLRRYGLRLLAGAVLAEVPFDLLFYGRLTLEGQNVMWTLLLGFLLGIWMNKNRNSILPFLLCFFGAEVLRTDYGGAGIGLIYLLLITKDRKNGSVVRLIGMAMLMLAMNSARITIGGLRIPVQIFALAAWIPIEMYSGRQCWKSRWVQRGFYLFYPVHLLVLALIVKKIVKIMVMGMFVMIFS